MPRNPRIQCASWHTSQSIKFLSSSFDTLCTRQEENDVYVKVSNEIDPCLFIFWRTDRETFSARLDRSEEMIRDLVYGEARPQVIIAEIDDSAEHGSER